MINRTVLVGRLTRDPEMRTTATGKSVVSFSIAVTKRVKPQDGQPDADFFRVTAWGQTAEYVANYMTKGRLVGVDGRLESRKFVDREGNNREVVEVVADNVQGLDRPKDDAAPAEGGPRHDPKPQPINRVPAAPSADYDPFADE
jgi:single-strand DNA-binding protein